MVRTSHRLFFTFFLVGFVGLISVASGCRDQQRTSSATGSESFPQKDVQSYKIGILTPLSGNNQEYGDRVRKGADFAVEEINAKGGIDGRKVEIVYEDTQMTPGIGVSAINKLIVVDRVPVILGAFGSSVTLAVAPVAEKNRVVLLSSSSTADVIKDAGEFIFRNVPPNRKQGADQARYAYGTLGARHAAILYITNDYGTTLRDAFRNEFLQLGGTVVTEDGFNEGTTDYRTLLQKTASRNPDVLYVPSHDYETGLLLKQKKEVGIKTPVLGADGSMTDTLLRVAGDAAEGSVYTSFGWSSEFATKFRQRFGSEPDGYAATSYDAIRVIADAIRRGGYEGEGIRDALTKTIGFPGVTGVTSFDRYGEVDKSFYQFAVRDGRFVQLGSTQ